MKNFYLLFFLLVSTHIYSQSGMNVNSEYFKINAKNQRTPSNAFFQLKLKRLQFIRKAWMMI